MNIHAGYRTAFELSGDRVRHRQRATRCARSVEPGRKAFGGEFSVLRIEQCAEDHDLAGEFAAEKFRVVTLDAGTQVGERKGLNIPGATLEIEGQRIRHRARNAIAVECHAPVRGQHRFGAECTRCQLKRHRGYRLHVARERQRYSAHHFVNVRIYIEWTDILLLAHGDPLSRRRPDRTVAAQDFAQHHLAGRRSPCKRPKEAPVEAAQSRTQQIVAERDLGLFNRRRKYDIESYDLRTAVDDSIENPTDLRSPGQNWRALERWAFVGLLVDCDDGDRRRGRIMARAKYLPAERSESVDRPAMDEAERWQDKSNATRQSDENDRDCISSNGAAHSDVRVIVLACLLHMDESANDRARPRSGPAIDQEDGPSRAQPCRVSTARLQRR